MFGIVRASLGALSARQVLFLGFLTLMRVFTGSLDLLGLALVGLTSSVAFGVIDPPSLLLERGLSPEEILLTLLVLAATSFTLKTVLGISLSKKTMIYLATIETIYSLKIASTIFGNSLSSVKTYSPAEVDWVVLRSTQKAFTGIIGHAANLVSDFFVALFIFCFFLWSDWRLALALTIYLSVVLVMFHLISRHFVARQGRLYSEGSVQVTEALRNLQNAYSEIVVFSRVGVFLDRLRTHRRVVAEAEAMHLYLAPIPRYIIELAIILGAAGFLLYQLTFQSSATDFSILGVFIAGSLRLVSSLLPLQRSFQFIRFEGPQARKAIELLQPESGSQHTMNAKRRTPNYPQRDPIRLGPESAVSVEFESVSFDYPGSDNDSFRLKNLSFSINAGEVAAIVGPSGAGKTTVVDLLLGLRLPCEGRVVCSGVSPSELRATRPGIIGYVPQRPGIVSGTILENIALGETIGEIDLDRVLVAVGQARLSDLIESLPDGLQTDVGKQGDSFSGGQIQRIGLARAMYFLPKLMVLDEPTSALDPKTEEAIIASLNTLRSEFTLIVISHRLQTIERADKILFIQDGELIRTGTFESLRTENPAFRNFVDSSLGDAKY